MKDRNVIKYSLGLLLVLQGFFVSCAGDEDIENPNKGKPAVLFNEESGRYMVKIGKTVTLQAVVENATDAVYTWKHEGKIVSTELSYIYNAEETGEFYHTFRVDASNGSVEEEVVVEVLEKTPPVVSLPVPEEGYITAIREVELELAPLVKFYEGASYEWSMDKTVAGTDSVFIFKQSVTGDYPLSLTVKNEDGTATQSFIIKVVEEPALSIVFEKEKLTVPVGRMCMLTPYISYQSEQALYSWWVNDELKVENSPEEIFAFLPVTEGTYNVTVVATDGDVTVSAIITVECVSQEGTYKREATAGSSPYSTKVFEFLPAPGQFINSNYTAVTMEQACAYAEKCLADVQYVSLGGFGGYIVVGFDHSIENVPDVYDFAIYGNAFNTSSEPGIVWVMQDENGDGLPNDTWYELRGSETGKPETIQNYAVTYYKPMAPEMDVQWTDNQGNKGVVEYRKVYHPQPYYYPNWVTARSYTLRGTCLKSTTSLENGVWVNPPMEWGYADNYGSDTDGSVNQEAKALANYFKIENAMYPDGTPVDLQYIDFVKVQTGINGSAGILGEVSTEVLRFEDIQINK